MFTLIALGMKSAIVACGAAFLATASMVSRFATANVAARAHPPLSSATGPADPEPEQDDVVIQPSWTVFMRGL
jgi:hypothetical protein